MIFSKSRKSRNLVLAKFSGNKVLSILRDVLNSDFEMDSGSEFGDLSSSEEMIDAGCRKRKPRTPGV